MPDSEQDVQQLEIIAKHFRMLTGLVEKLLFPWKFESFELFADTSKWPKTKAFVYIFLNPLVGFDKRSTDINLIMIEFSSPIVWCVILFWLLGLGITLLVGSIGLLNSASSNREPSKLAMVIAYAILILSILVMINVYLQLAHFIANRRIHWKYKIRWLGLFSGTVWLLEAYIAQRYDLTSWIFPASMADRVLFLIAVFFLLLPCCVVISASILLVGWRTLQVLGYFLRYVFLSLNDPLPMRDIKKAVIEPTEVDGEYWRLIDLSKEDILILRDWARDNLASTEKKTIPLAILLATLSLFANNTRFQNSIENIISFLFNLGYLRSGFSWGQYLISSIALLFVASLLMSFVFLFRNLIVQGVVIQACTLALSIKAKQERDAMNRHEWPSLGVLQRIRKSIKDLILG